MAGLWSRIIGKAKKPAPGVWEPSRYAREDPKEVIADAKMRAKASEILGPPAFGSPDDAQREYERLTEAALREHHGNEIADMMYGPKKGDAVRDDGVEESGPMFDPDAAGDVFAQYKAGADGEALEDLREAVGKREVAVNVELEALRGSVEALRHDTGQHVRQLDRSLQHTVAADEAQRRAMERASERLESLEDRVGVLSSGEGADGEREVLAGVEESVRTLVRSVEGLAGDLQALQKDVRVKGLDMQSLEGARGVHEQRLGAVERNVAGHEASLAHLCRVGAAAGERLRASPRIPGGTVVGDVARGLEDTIAAGDEALKRQREAPADEPETRLDFGEAAATKDDVLRRLLQQRTEQLGVAVAERDEARDLAVQARAAQHEKIRVLTDERAEAARALQQIALTCGFDGDAMPPAEVARCVAAWKSSATIRGEMMKRIGLLVEHQWLPSSGVPDPERLEQAVRDAMARADAPGEAWERVALALGDELAGAQEAHALASAVEDVIAERDSLRARKASGAAAEDTAMVRQLRERLGMGGRGGDPIDLLDDVLGKGREVGERLERWRRAGERAKAVVAQAEDAAQRAHLMTERGTTICRWTQQAEHHAGRARQILSDVE